MYQLMRETRIFFMPFEKYYDTVFFSDVVGVLELQPFSHSIACIEQTVCSCANIFVGTRWSTFSGYITRLRGHRRSRNAEIYFTDGYKLHQNRNPMERVSWSSWLEAGNQFWGREYQEGWEL
jgi:hypothetical protein